mgnify:CR=1 FL=1
MADHSPSQHRSRRRTRRRPRNAQNNAPPANHQTGQTQPQRNGNGQGYQAAQEKLPDVFIYTYTIYKDAE